MSGLVAFEVILFLRPLKMVDHAAHLGGMMTGVISAQVYKMRQEKRGEKKEIKQPARWYEIVLGKQGAR